jgi:hypothetical protein
LSASAIQKVDNFISTFSDVPEGYKSDLLLEFAAYVFSWDGKKTYSLQDVVVID